MPSFSQILAQSVTDAGVKATVVYATAADLPLVGNTAGDIALVSETHRLYIFTGAGWYNVALINTNPTIITAPDGSYSLATDGTPIVITLQAQDPEEVPIAWSYAVTSGALGSTATVSQADNVFTITPSTNRGDAGEFSITFTASDGVNLATAASSFTLTFGTEDQYYNYSSLLLKSGSTAGLNNHTFVDESTNGFTVTRSGDVYQGSLSPYSPAGWSNYFDGTGDYLAVPSSTQFGFGTGDFTWDMWVFPTASPTNGPGTLLDFRAAATASATNLRINSSFYLTYYNGTANIETAFTSQTVALNVWSHIAIVRSGNTVFGYINGLLAGSVAVSSNLGSNQPLWIGQNRSAGYNFNGYISNLRVVKGTAVYTTAFTPPTEPLTAVSGTSLLTLQDNRFKDNSTNNFTITKNGDTKITPFSPFNPTLPYSTSVNGSSAYFDGTGDYLTVPSNAVFQFGTGDFTVECWIYKSSAANGTIIDARGSNAAAPYAFYVDGSNFPYFYDGTSRTSTVAILNSQWNHIAVVRTSGVLKIFVNGVEGYSASYSVALNPSATVYIGGQNFAQSVYTTGYISNLRIVKGTAVYTTAFTPPTEPLTAISGTSLLLNMNNAGIYDEMTKNNIKLIGNATTSTTQTKYSDTSVYFDGSSTILLPDSMNGDFGTGDFTIETWIRPESTSGARVWLDNDWNNTTYAFNLDLSNNKFNFYNSNGASSTIALTSVTSWTLNTWYHIAYVKSAGVLNLYVNGVFDNSVAMNVQTGRPGQSNIFLGAQTGNSNYFTGYLEDFRITKGVARYTTGFTPPTAPLGFSNAE